jgi:hypothetical protein
MWPTHLEEVKEMVWSQRQQERIVLQPVRKAVGWAVRGRKHGRARRAGAVFSV